MPKNLATDNRITEKSRIMFFYQFGISPFICKPGRSFKGIRDSMLCFFHHSRKGFVDKIFRIKHIPWKPAHYCNIVAGSKRTFTFGVDNTVYYMNISSEAKSPYLSIVRGKYGSGFFDGNRNAVYLTA